jgi:hypothetical protein
MRPSWSCRSWIALRAYQGPLPQRTGKGQAANKNPSLTCCGEGLPLLPVCPSCTTTFPRRLLSVPAEAGFLARTQTHSVLLQLRDSAGLGPASPLVPLTSGVWGTSAVAVCNCSSEYTHQAANRQTTGAWCRAAVALIVISRIETPGMQDQSAWLSATPSHHRR